MYKCPQCGRMSFVFEAKSHFARCVYYMDCDYTLAVNDIAELLRRLAESSEPARAVIKEEIPA